MTVGEATVHVQTMEDLFQKLQTEDTLSLCMTAINSIRQIDSMNLAMEYQNTEYLEFAKSVLESKRSTIEEEFSDEHDLLQKTEELIQFIEDDLQREADDQFFNEMQENQRPGKPIASYITAHTIQLSWNPANMFGQDDYYQVSYKDNSNNGKWKVLAAEHSMCTAQVTDLIPNTKYIFRVRVVSQKGEGSLGPDSGEYTTDHCSAFETTGSAELISERGKMPAKYRLQIKQIYENTEAKIRMFEIGNQIKLMENEMTIILVGDNETEKSDFVNGILNYVKAVHWSDPFRFVVSDVETQILYSSNTNQRGTEWITCYIIYPEQNDLIRYQINVIDIPASSRTPNQTAIEQLNQLFTEKEGSKAFKEINSLCIFGKTNVSLDHSERLFNSVLSCFGNDLQKITCAIITLDDQKLPFLPALGALNIPVCIFHNSSLFASTAMINKAKEEKVIWEKDLRAFEAYFTHLKYSRPCDLKLTTNVIAKRLEMNQNIHEIQSKVDEGENKLKQLQNEKQNLLEVMKTLEDNSNYTYEVEEERHVKKDLPQGDNSTVCSICFYTCHPGCGIASTNKRQCSSMEDEHCTKCPKKCHWERHTRVSYVYEKVNVKVQKTNDDMFQKYTNSSKEQLALESTLKNQKYEINNLCQGINNIMQEVSECRKEINECAFVRGPFDVASQVEEKLGVQNFNERALKETQYTNVIVIVFQVGVSNKHL